MQNAENKGVKVKMIVFSDELLEKWIEKWFGDNEVREAKFNEVNWKNFTDHNRSYAFAPPPLQPRRRQEVFQGFQPRVYR